MADSDKIRFLFGNRAAWTVVVGAIFYGGYLRSVNLGPESLWLDDVWVAMLSKAPTLQDFFSSGSSSPPLFNASVALCIRLLPGPELSAQIFPFLCANLAIGASAIAAYVVCRRAWAGSVAAVIVACHPEAIEFAARVKQYPSDMLFVASHVVGFSLLIDRPNVRALWIYTLATCICLLWSTVSLFVAAAFYPLAMMQLARGGLAVRHLLSSSTVVLASMMMVFFGIVRPGVNTALREYWGPHYLSTGSASAFIQSALNVLEGWMAGSLHGQSWVLAAGTGVLALGAGTLIIAGRRSYVAANFVLLFGVLLASGLRRFPLGTGRVDLFVVPLIAILIGAGVSYIAHTTFVVPRILWAAAVATFMLLKFPAPRKLTYPIQVSSPIVATLAQEKSDNDALLVNVHATFALGYYSSWRSRFVPDSSLGTGFHVVPQTPHVYVIGEQPDDPKKSIALAVGARPSRIFFLAIHAADSLRAKVEEHLASAGWKLERREQQRGGADLSVFTSDAAR